MKISKVSTPIVISHRKGLSYSQIAFFRQSSEVFKNYLTHCQKNSWDALREIAFFTGKFPPKVKERSSLKKIFTWKRIEKSLCGKKKTHDPTRFFLSKSNFKRSKESMKRGTTENEHFHILWSQIEARIINLIFIFLFSSFSETLTTPSPISLSK